MKFSVEHIKSRGICFYSINNNFSYVCHCLAHGLDELGIPIFSNISYQNTSVSEFQFTRTEGPGNFFLMIVDIRDNNIVPYQPLPVKAPPNSVIFSMSDRNGELYIKDRDKPVFCTHENRYYRFHSPRIPWAFGLSDKIIRESEKRRKQQKTRENVILRNFRPSGNQSIRDCLDLVLLPHLEKYFRIDSEIIDDRDNHFDRLSSYLGCLAYGGNFHKDFMPHVFFRDNPFYKAFYSHVRFLKEPVITRWDSWRFWESLAMGCLTFHLDFDKYGFRLPVIPENWKHYIGLDLANIREDVERVMDERERLPEIAEAGRKWALDNYSPAATARRFLSIFAQA